MTPDMIRHLVKLGLFFKRRAKISFDIKCFMTHFAKLVSDALKVFIIAIDR